MKRPRSQLPIKMRTIGEGIAMQFVARTEQFPHMLGFFRLRFLFVDLHDVAATLGVSSE